MTIIDFAKRVSCLAGLKGEIVLEERGSDKKVKKIVPDVTKIKNLGWVQHVTLDFGIDRTLNWIKSI